MSYQVGAACYSTAEAAASASASSMVGSVVSHGGSAYVVGVGGVAADSITYSLQPVAGGAPFVVVSPYQPQECGLLTAADAGTMAWGVAAVWLAVYALMFLARTFWKFDDKESGDGYS